MLLLHARFESSNIRSPWSSCANSPVHPLVPIFPSILQKLLFSVFMTNAVDDVSGPVSSHSPSTMMLLTPRCTRCSTPHDVAIDTRIQPRCRGLYGPSAGLVILRVTPRMDQ